MAERPPLESIAPEDAWRIAVEAHRRARELREASRQEIALRDVAVQVAVLVSGHSQRRMAAALGVSRTQVQHILDGRNGGRHLRADEVYGTDESIDLDGWLRKLSG